MTINPSDLLPIVAKLTESYTSKESTSISYETARQLMKAILYCLEENEQANSSNQELKNMSYEISLFSAYEQGYKKVLKKVQDAKEIYNTLIPTFQSYGNWFLEDTIKQGMPSFFLYYDAKFNPQNHILTLDYSTIQSVQSLCGIDAIYQYLTYIQLEQDFLAVFPMDYIISILTNYHRDYKELPINICEIVFQHLLSCSLIGINLSTIYFTKKEREKSSDYVFTHTRAQIENDLTILTNHLVNNIFKENQPLFDYLSTNIKDFTTTLLQAAKSDCLSTIYFSK